VTRYHPDTGQLEMLAVERPDTKQWSIPGGMLTSQVDEEETESTLQIIGSKLGAEVKAALKSSIDGNPPQIIFRGYVDDPRNTDNAWLEVMQAHSSKFAWCCSHRIRPIVLCRRRPTTSTTRAHS
jgi:hypothetical protein